MNIKPLTEIEQQEISIEELMRLLLRYFKDFHRENISKNPNIFVRIDIGYFFRTLCPIPPGRHFSGMRSGSNIENLIKYRPDFAMKFFEAISLLQKHGLIAPIPVIGHGTSERALYFFLTECGQKSTVEDDDILLVDSAEEIVQSIRNEVCNLDQVVEEFYRESIRAFQEGLTLASIFCLGAAIERIFYNLADAVTNYEKSYRSKFGQTWGNTTMKDRVKKLNSWFSNIKENNPPSDPRFIVLLDKLFDKLEDMAKWYGITRNENIHTAYKESPFPEPRAIEIKILDFRLYAITIFQIIDSLQP